MLGDLIENPVMADQVMMIPKYFVLDIFEKITHLSPGVLSCSRNHGNQRKTEDNVSTS